MQLSSHRFWPRLVLSILLLLLTSNAWAWKPTTHVYLGSYALEDALDDGRVTIPRIDPKSGQMVESTYQVDPKTLSALRSHAPQYRAGILGPDAYPDMLTGQQVIHPSASETSIIGGPNAWLEHLWRQAESDNSDAVRAFTIGYLTHAAGDMFGHTFVNNFSGGPFAITPPKGPQNAIKHIIVEGYVDKRINADRLDANFFNASISGVDDFIYRNMIDARPGTVLSDKLLKAGGEGTGFSIPRMFSSIRADLQRDIDNYYATKSDYDRRASNCGTWDFGCSKVGILAEKQAYIVANGIQTTYKEYWRDDIDEGLRAWPGVSHEVAKALFFNSSRKADIDRAEAILTKYSTDHLLSMAGSPDFVGLGIGAINSIIEAITPDFLLEPIRKLKENLLNTMLQAAIGMDKDQLKAYMTSPDKYFDQILTSGDGQNVSLQRFNADFLKINDPGYTNPRESFEIDRVPAAYNTMVMSKLILLSPSEVNRFLQDVGSSQRLQQPNVMLGFIDTLDGSNQWWKQRMVLSKDSNAYRRVFKKQAGENSHRVKWINETMSVNIASNLHKKLQEK